MMPSSRTSRSTRSRKTETNIDLNAVAPVDDSDQVGMSMCSNPQFSRAALGGSAAPTAPIDLEDFDDDVIISTPGAFAEAKNKSQRNHERAVVVDVDSAITKRRRTSYMAPGIYINLEASGNSVRADEIGVLQRQPTPALPPPPPPPPPKEPTFNCPVCMGPLVEEMSTKCGHIFCKDCIKTSIAAQKKCPTCRRKVTLKDIIRVYLPATSS